MNDPRDRGTAVAPPIIGSGCTQRYDPEAMAPEAGTSFPEARRLWLRLQAEAQEDAGFAKPDASQ